MKFQIKSRWHSDVRFECELDTNYESQPYGIQIGAAIKLAIRSGSDLRGSDLSGSNLSDSDLRDCNLSGSNLSDSDLSDCNLSGSDLRDCNLSGSDLSGSDLSDCNLRDWIPKITNIHQTVYNAARAKNALEMSSWHCGTAHCRAGWVVTLAGASGRVLEGFFGTAPAAALIYQASDPSLSKIPDFYCNNKTALADMKRLAEEEAARATP